MAVGRTARTGASIGTWRGDASSVERSPAVIAQRLRQVEQPVFVVELDGGWGVSGSGSATMGHADGEGLPLLAVSPPCGAHRLGDAAFARTHGLRFNYVAGAMAGGIASVELVEAMARAGMLAFFGAAGLGVREVAAAIDRLSTNLLDRPWGANLIHSPYEPELERAVADLYVRSGVQRVSASAYLDLTLPLLRYRLHGIHRAPDGSVVAPNRVIAKVSRVEVAQKFLSPPPPPLLRELVADGALTEQAATLAETVPVANDLTVEADSGGHTDNRAALTLLPTMLALRDRMHERHGGSTRARVGAAGGIGTPHAAAAAFAMGADYVVTGTINQTCGEAGTSDAVRQMLAEAGEADVMMAPAADMFEMGVQLQVLRRGTMFGMRARKLWEVYRAHASLDELPDPTRQSLERSVFGCSLEEVWTQTQRFWDERDPSQLERAKRDPKHRMALCFRWYLGLSSRWANTGEPKRRLDYQVWCGPAIGAFNAWTDGSFLQDWNNRNVVTVALNLMHGAAVLGRVASLRAQGIPLSAEHVDVRPRPLGAIEEI